MALNNPFADLGAEPVEETSDFSDLGAELVQEPPAARPVQQKSEIQPVRVEGPSDDFSDLGAEPVKDANFFEGVRNFAINMKDKVEQIAFAHQQAEQAKQVAAAQADADPANWSSERYKKEAPKPQTVEEQAIYDATVQEKQLKEENVRKVYFQQKYGFDPEEQQKEFASLMGPDVKIEAMKPQSFFDKIKSGVTKLYQPNTAKSANILNMANYTGAPIRVVEHHYEELTKELGMRDYPNASELINAAMMLALPMTIEYVGPLAVAKGIAEFTAAKEGTERVILPAGRAVWQKMTNQEVRYETAKLQDLFPEGMKDLGTISEFILYGMGAKFIDNVLSTPGAVQAGSRLMGELNGIRGRILRKMGFKMEMGLEPIKYEAAQEAFPNEWKDIVSTKEWNRYKSDLSAKVTEQNVAAETSRQAAAKKPAKAAASEPPATVSEAAPHPSLQVKPEIIQELGATPAMAELSSTQAKTFYEGKIKEIDDEQQGLGDPEGLFNKLTESEKAFVQNNRDAILQSAREEAKADVLEDARGRGIPEEAGESNRPSVPGERVEPKPEVEPQKPETDAIEAEPVEARPGEEAEMAASDWQKNLEREAKTKGRINKTDIVRWTEEAFGVPIRSKLTHAMKKAAGFYKTKDQLIRLKKWGELEVLTHEAAHHIDFGLIEPDAGSNWRTKDIPPGSKQRASTELANLDYDQSQRRGYEGWAEYVRHWVTDTGYAQKLAPTFTKFFEGDFKKLYPDVAKKLEKMRELYKIWDKQGAVARVLGHVDFKGEHSKLPLSKKIAGLTDWFRKQFIDEFYILKDIETELGIESRKDVRPTKSPYEMATYMKQKSSGVARTFVTEAAVDEFGNRIGKSLVDIIKPIVSGKDIVEIMKPTFMRSHEGTKLGEFIAYWISRRALNLGERGIESGFDSADAQFIVEKFKSPEFDKVAEELTEWSDHLVDWVARAGGFKPGTEDLFRALNPIYVPFKRAFIENAGTTGVGKLFSRSTGVMGIKGSGRPIINPFESLIKSASEMVSKAHKLRLSNLVADLAKNEGAGKWVSKIPLASTVKDISVEKVFDQLSKALAEEGRRIPDLEAVKDEILTIFGKTAKYNKGNVVPVFRNGELELYELHPDLYSTLQGLDPIQLNAITKILSPFTRFLRLGATGVNAAFGLVRNPIRDFITAAMFSKDKTYTPLSPISGIARELTAKPGDPADRFKAVGGDISSQMGYDRAQTMAVYDEALVKALGPAGKVLYIAKHPIDTLRRLVNVPEMGPRIAELEASMKRYQKEHPEWSDDDVFVAAFNDAQDVTINFSRSGKLGKQINQAVFAFNAAMQGPNKFYRAMRENPAGTVARGLVWLSLAAVASWYYAKDKEWYKNLPPAYRYNNLFFEMPDGNVMRVPIPYDIGTVFASAPMAMLDANYQNDPDLYKGLIDIAVSQVPNPLEVSAFGPYLDVKSNTDYLNRPIESMAMKRLPSEERKFDWTPEYASALSRGFNQFGVELSPIQISYMLNSYSGGMASRLPGGTKQTGSAADIPVAGTLFMRDTTRPVHQLDQFYDRFREVSEMKAADSFKSYKDHRDYQRYSSFQKTFVTPLTKKARELKARGNEEGAKKVNKLLSQKLNQFLESGRE